MRKGEPTGVGALGPVGAGWGPRGLWLHVEMSLGMIEAVWLET